MSGVDYKGATIIHNHPISEGLDSFGQEDFMFLRENQNVKELIAVNSEYSYSVKVVRDISKVTYSDMHKGGVAYNTGKMEEYQHAMFLWLKAKGYVKYEREGIK